MSYIVWKLHTLINHFLNVNFLILSVVLNKQERTKNYNLLFKTKKCFDIWVKDY